LNLKELSTKFNLQTKFVTGNSKIFGWQSESVVFNDVIEEIKPKTIIEIGSWVGASAIHMAKCLKANNIDDFQILCVDTFLGSNASLWIENFINVDNVFQEQYNQFNINVTNSGFNENISALPMTSSSAAELCDILNVQVDLIYIDAGHQEKEVYDDLNDWWPISTKMVFGDDYSETWSGVKKAVNRFAQEKNINFQEKDSKFIFRH
jgi:hypothetical protein